MSKCRACGTAIQPFMSFGKMPRANAYLETAGTSDEFFFELAPCVCGTCHLFQLEYQPEPKEMFNENYAFFSSTSTHMQIHFREFAIWAIDRHLHDRIDPFVVEIGSNDGTMLRNFKERSIRHLGVEPSLNVAAVAIKNGSRTITEFFNAATARQIVTREGQADVILAANVIAHIADLPSVAQGVAVLLKSNGVFIFENAYLGSVIANTAYDQIYDEHVFTFCAMSVKNAFGRHGLELVDILAQPTHGGSMRFVLAHKGQRPVEDIITRVLAAEASQGLDSAETYAAFRTNCELSRSSLRALIGDLHVSGAKVAGYGATAKSTTVLNYCGIGADKIAWITDNTPAKQGKLTPGAHIPVVPRAYFEEHTPDFAVLFAWNHAAEILDKEKKFIEGGGKWITYVPKVGMLDGSGLLLDMPV